MISRNTGRTASRGKAPLAAAVRRSQHRTLALGNVERLAPLALVAADLAHHLGAPVEQRQDLIVDGVDRRAQASRDRRARDRRASRDYNRDSSMNVSAHPSVLFALGAGLLTGLTPCVYPMIPITLAIFGVKAGTPRRARWRSPPRTSPASP